MNLQIFHSEDNYAYDEPDALFKSFFNEILNRIIFVLDEWFNYDGIRGWNCEDYPFKIRAS